ncbi:TPA: hypothetical protein G8W59_004233 [Salmonella enterica]|uniref:Fimbrial protein n=1 Tax=Salmonella enterica TaxID=28901 RepID=A0A759KBJ0_SALER|nr:hypothetical protein [Salmonella enterica]
MLKIYYLLLMLASTTVSVCSQPLAHWQDGIVVGREAFSGSVTTDTGQQIKRLLWQESSSQWNPFYSGLTTRPDAFTVMPGSFSSGNNTKPGSRMTSLEDIPGRSPVAEESVVRWQGNLTPVVNYF